MKGADSQVRDVDFLFEPICHLGRSFVREGECEDVLGFYAAFYEVQDLLCHDARLA